MQAEDFFASRLDRIQDFLTNNGAGLYAKLLYNLPVLHQASINPQLTMIIAPADARLERLVGETGKLLSELFSTEAGRDLLANHISTSPTQKVYPMFTAINDVTYGSDVNDLIALNVIKSTVIDGVVILITPRLIGLPQQLVKTQKQLDPGVFAGITRDAFQAMIRNGDIRGKDLISFCNSNPYVDTRFCRSTDNTGRTIFHYLMKEEFGVDVPINQDARDKYIEYHKEAEFVKYPTVLVLIDQGNSRQQFYMGKLKRYMSTLSRRVPKETGITVRIGNPPRPISKTFNNPFLYAIDDLLHALWIHPINLYLLISVYSPRPNAKTDRVTVANLISDPDGPYLSEENRLRFRLSDDPILNIESVFPDEKPLIQRVIHYTRPYPETLPFLYKKTIQNYDPVMLAEILPAFYVRSSGKPMSFQDPDILPLPTTANSIVDFMKGRSLSQQLQLSIDTSLKHLSRRLLNGDNLERLMSLEISGYSEPQTIGGRFFDSYLQVRGDALILIFSLILLFSGAVVIEDVQVIRRIGH